MQAAKLISNPEDSSNPLTKAEKSAVQHDTGKTFWDQTKPLRSTFYMLFLAATVQGWTQTGINAANLSWPLVLGVVRDPAEACVPPSGRAPWIIAGVNAATYLTAGLGCWLSDPLNELFFGRRPAILFSALLILVAAIGCGVSQTWYSLLGFRVMMGLGMGCKAAVVPVYAAEIAPDHLRGMEAKSPVHSRKFLLLIGTIGSLVMNWQVFDGFGIFLGFVANLVASASVDSYVAWRWQLACLCIPAFALLFGTLFVSWDSPRFLMKHEQKFYNDYEKRKERAKSPWLKRLFIADLFKASTKLPYRSPAFETLALMRGEPILAAKELIFTHCQLLVETSADYKDQEDSVMKIEDFSLHHSLMWIGRMRRGLYKPHVRREARAAAIVMFAQQLCGINVLIFYSSSLFCNTDNSSDPGHLKLPLYLNLGLGLTNFVFAFPAYRWIESHGRRWLLLTTLPLLTLFLVAASAAAGSRHLTELSQDLVAVFTFLFVATYSVGLGPVPFTLCAELFPLEQRMIGMSWGVSVNFFFAGILTLVVPIIISTPLNASGVFGIFAVLNVLAFVLIWRYLPEVVGPPIDNDDGRRSGKRKAINLDVMFGIFSKPLTHFRKYNWTVYMPYAAKYCKYWLRRYVLLRGREEAPEAPIHYLRWLQRQEPRQLQDLREQLRQQLAQLQTEQQQYVARIQAEQQQSAARIQAEQRKKEQAAAQIQILQAQINRLNDSAVEQEQY